MLRPVRLIVLLLISFVAGIFYERANARETCETTGGAWARSGICLQEVRTDE